MVRKQKPDLVCFQETKIREMSNRFVRSLGVGRNLGRASLDVGSFIIDLSLFLIFRKQSRKDEKLLGLYKNFFQ